MENLRGTRICQKCKAVVLLDNIRLYPKDKDTNILVCEKCCEELKKATDPKTYEAKKSNISNLPTAEYKRYRCSRCGYPFRVDISKAGITHNLHCPYCGETSRLSRKG